MFVTNITRNVSLVARERAPVIRERAPLHSAVVVVICRSCVVLCRALLVACLYYIIIILCIYFHRSANDIAVRVTAREAYTRALLLLLLPYDGETSVTSRRTRARARGPGRCTRTDERTYARAAIGQTSTHTHHRVCVSLFSSRPDRCRRRRRRPVASAEVLKIRALVQ